MLESDCNGGVVADPSNSIVTPLYFDRQIVRASDLSLDRESHDAALARMRRLLHGWGIVSGLIPEQAGNDFVLTPGYAVTPSGAEIFLPKTVNLNDIQDQMRAFCGSTEPGCELINEDEQRNALSAYAQQDDLLSAWLIARPAHSDAEERAGVPEGCTHPASQMLPTRRCHKVQLELMCNLPTDKLLSPPECEEMQQLVCGFVETGLRRPLPYPPVPGAEEDFVVIGLLETDAQKQVIFSPYHRRALLPVSVLQDWVQSCLCPFTFGPQSASDEDTPAPVDVSEGAAEDLTTETDDDRNDTMYWVDYLATETAHNQPDLTLAEDFETAVPRDRAVHATLADEARRDALEHVGVDGPEAFLGADVAKLAATMGVPAATVMEMKEAIIKESDTWAGADTKVVTEDWAGFTEELTAAGVSSDWAAAEAPPSTRTVATAPMITRVAGSAAELQEKGLSGPADLMKRSDAELVELLGVSTQEAAAIRADMTRFVSIMGGR